VTIAIERRGAVAVIRHHHPPRNFMTARLLHELRRAWTTLERDPSVRVVVLAGARDGAFLLHTEVAQIRELLASTRLPGPVLRLALPVMRACAWLLGRWPWLADRVLAGEVRTAPLEVAILFDAIERSSKVTIAAINGPCLSGGLELALCFDYRIMLDDPALRIGCPEVLIGLLPGFGGSQRLTRLLGAARARELLLSGELLAPRQAAAAGRARDRRRRLLAGDRRARRAAGAATAAGGGGDQAGGARRRDPLARPRPGARAARGGAAGAQPRRPRRPRRLRARARAPAGAAARRAADAGRAGGPDGPGRADHLRGEMSRWPRC
jgi:enoyl-CoA hydratase/carnithine racemase